MIQKQFTANWVSLFRNHINTQLEGLKEPFISFQFSTIGTDGFPKNRTVVYRGFLFDDESTNVITFTTDKRMSKYEELSINDKFEAVFYLNNAKRQYRLCGHARIIDDTTTPNICLHKFKPRDVGTSDSDSEEEIEGNDDTILELPAQDIQEITNKLKHSEVSDTRDTDIQERALDFNLLSPRLLKRLYKEHNSSFTSLTSLNDINFQADLQEVNLVPPTRDEYNDELQRQWEGLSKNLKKSFRRPTPGSNMTPEKAKLIDSIKRGVDGKKDIDGFKNFAVICLFTDRVDFYDSENDKRYFFEKDKYDLWVEHEVCP